MPTFGKRSREFLTFFVTSESAATRHEELVHVSIEIRQTVGS